MQKPYLLLAALALVPLSGCVTIGATPPSSLLSLNATAKPPVGQSQLSNAASTITISIPTISQELSSSRIPVRSRGTAVAFVKDAQWVERPSQLFQRLLSDTVTARTGRLVFDARQTQVFDGSYLTGQLRSFGVDADTQSAIVTYDASLVRGAPNVVEKRRFEARVPVARIESNAVGVALNVAANQVANEVAEWVGR